jgi:hypothetical protein
MTVNVHRTVVEVARILPGQTVTKDSMYKFELRFGRGVNSGALFKNKIKFNTIGEI